MNKFTFTSFKFVLFGAFLILVGILVFNLFIGPFRNTDTSSDDTPDIPAVIYLSETDASSSDLSGSDISMTDAEAEA